MYGMRFLLAARALSIAALAAAAASLTGCAATVGGGGADRVVVDGAQARSSEAVQVTEVTEVVQPTRTVEAAPVRRRLSQTVTLGQGSDAAYSAAPAAQQGTGSNGGVVVNNNVTVVNGAPAVYGGYGYGGYGYGGGSYSRSDSAGRSVTSGSSGSRGYAPSGWEGAGRTAQPGRTPGVGGNWAPATSHGPRSMK